MSVSLEARMGLMIWAFVCVTVLENMNQPPWPTYLNTCCYMATSETSTDLNARKGRDLWPHSQQDVFSGQLFLSPIILCDCNLIRPRNSPVTFDMSDLFCEDSVLDELLAVKEPVSHPQMWNNHILETCYLDYIRITTSLHKWDMLL